MNKFLVIYNFPQKYRTGIFCAMDHVWNCKWIFGDNKSDIKEMDTSMLKDVSFVKNLFLKGPIYYQQNVSAEASKAEYDAIIMLGEPFNLTTWNIMLRNKFKYNRKKIYLWSHGWYGREKFAKKLLKKIYFGLADKVFLYGNYARQVAIKQGFNADKLVVIHNSLNHDNQLSLRQSLNSSDIYRKHFGNDNPVIIFIGRLSKVKRLDMLIEAVSILKKRNKEFNIVIIGDGVMRSALEDLVIERNLKEQVWFFGECYDDTKNAQLIYDADLCVAPGNVGLTAMHTMVFGTPVLTHDDFSKQMPEFEAIIPNRTGSFYRYNDLYSLAAEIENWFEKQSCFRERIRQYCFAEIDKNWTPQFQINVLKGVIDDYQK